MHSFVFNVEKLQNHQLQHAHAHNVRSRPTKSQLPPSAWFTSEGRHSAIEWDVARLSAAHGLAKRKDAVEALSFVIQFGDQTVWREEPNRANKHGKPKPDWPVNPKEAGEAIERWAAQEFGLENLVSLELHTDESTPHFHLVVTPIHDGKLQAKHWLNGAASVAALRKRAHAEISKTVACTYQPGEPGGAAHDPSKAAGAINGRQAELEVGLIGRLKGDDVRQENERLQAENDQLKIELKLARQAARLADKQRLRRDEERELRKLASQVEASRLEKASVFAELVELQEKLRNEQRLTEQLRPEERAELIRRLMHAMDTQIKIEQLEVRRCNGEISDRQVADWLLAQDGELRQKTYRQYIGFENDVLALVEASKHARTAQQPNEAELHQTPKSAPDCDYGPSLG